MPAVAVRRTLAVAVLAVAALVVACGDTTPSPSASTGTQSTPTPGVPTQTIGRNVVFNGCGGDRQGVVTPVVTTGDATPNLAPTSAEQALNSAHLFIAYTYDLADQQVYCKAGMVPGSLAQQLLPSHPPLPQQVWAVVAFITVRNPQPGSGAPAGTYSIIFISPTSPVHAFGDVPLRAGTPLPDAFAGLDPQP